MANFGAHLAYPAPPRTLRRRAAPLSAPAAGAGVGTTLTRALTRVGDVLRLLGQGWLEVDAHLARSPWHADPTGRIGAAERERTARRRADAALLR